jgi:hypothetical protein
MCNSRSRFDNPKTTVVKIDQLVDDIIRTCKDDSCVDVIFEMHMRYGNDEQYNAVKNRWNESRIYQTLKRVRGSYPDKARLHVSDPRMTIKTRGPDKTQWNWTESPWQRLFSAVPVEQFTPDEWNDAVKYMINAMLHISNASEERRAQDFVARCCGIFRESEIFDPNSELDRVAADPRAVTEYYETQVYPEMVFRLNKCRLTSTAPERARFLAVLADCAAREYCKLGMPENNMITAVLFDVFALARMFSNFSKTKRPNTSCGRFGYPRNIVAIVGNAHATVWTEFFRDFLRASPLMGYNTSDLDEKYQDIINDMYEWDHKNRNDEHSSLRRAQCLLASQYFDFWADPKKIIANNIIPLELHNMITDMDS